MSFCTIGKKTIVQMNAFHDELADVDVKTYRGSSASLSSFPYKQDCITVIQIV